MAKYFFYAPKHVTRPASFILNQRHHGQYPAVLYHTLINGKPPYRHNLTHFSFYKTQAVPVPAELNQMIDYVWERVYDVSKG